MGLASDEVTAGGVATLIIDSGGTATAGAIKIGPSGTVFLNGTLSGTVTNGGTINPGFSPGTGTIVGDATFTDGSVLNIEVEGVQAGEFDKLVVSERVTLQVGSTINISTGGATLDAGSVVILEAAVVEGTTTIILDGSDLGSLTVSDGTGIELLINKAGRISVVEKRKSKTKTKTKGGG